MALLDIQGSPVARIVFMALVSNTSPTSDPLVTISIPKTGSQLRIAFNATLARLAELDKVKYMFLDFDANAQSLTFIESDKAESEGVRAFPVMADGGSSRGTKGRAIFLHRKLIPALGSGKFSPKLKLRRGRHPLSFSIQLTTT